jgi:hypothetical protein
MGGMKKRLTSAKTARDPDSRINKALRKWNCEESFRQKLTERRQERIEENPLIAPAIGWALDQAKNFLKGTPSKGDDVGDTGGPAVKTQRGGLLRSKPNTQTQSTWKGARHGSETSQSRYKASLEKQLNAPSKKQVAENKISDIQKMINEDIGSMDLEINGRTITLNNSMAKKIIRVYESVNTKNKKIVETMLNEDLDSFKKLLNFSIKA